MTVDLTAPESGNDLAAFYRAALLDDVIPFWLRHGLDRDHGGILSCLDRDGAVIDTDKSMWIQGRAGWMFATLVNTVERRPEWLDAARSCVEFSRRHGFAPGGKMYFTVTRDGRPLRMRRYVYSEAFAAIANAAFARAAGDARAADDAVAVFARYLRYSFEQGVMTPKFEPTRPSKNLGPLFITIATAQELRANLGDLTVGGRTCTGWIDASIAEIARDFLKPQLAALMETVGPAGEILDHADGRTLNPGHAIECAWFILHEAGRRKDHQLLTLGTSILDWMWARGWDPQHGGLLSFTDLRGLPVQEYWHDMKFWWPHCEALLATLLAWTLTRDPRYAAMHRQVHDWSFAHFPDPDHGEWFGYLHRDGTVSQPAKGNLFKGPFHLPRMLLGAWRILASPASS
ncbi:MAG: AGE family epimerase/isomerase [Verrucomicrobia bacterium]|nr:AGE family epimerase/isomerase [Verrucomicrobiota bacterium]